ncbi:hypothetical protein E3N88_20946 [Mikania micrantha]|uniref:Uncharacterized protein n=1 Tax=Mikania micrantha TaxID=192012 RepID=A0A5N6NKD4_9ASTR|nr:hypothetical protein E3N88_20946 [Mikania micrantha]
MTSEGNSDQSAATARERETEPCALRCAPWEMGSATRCAVRDGRPTVTGVGEADSGDWRRRVAAYDEDGFLELPHYYMEGKEITRIETNLMMSNEEVRMKNQQWRFIGWCRENLEETGDGIGNRGRWSHIFYFI